MRSTLAAVAIALGFAGCSGKNTTQPLISGVGNLVAFSSNRDGSYDIFLYDLNGLKYYALPNLNDTSADERHPSLGSDAQVLAFATNRASGMGDYDIMIYDLGTSNFAPTPPINTPAREDEPAFTGNALSLLFVRDTLGVRRVRFFYGVTDRYIPQPGFDAPPGFNDWAPAPDNRGSLVAFVSDRNGNPDVFVYDSGGDSLLDLPDLASDSTDTDPSLTPDGRYLCFASTRTGGMGGFDLYLYDLSTKSFVTLAASVNTPQDERHPSINADGTKISFQSTRTDGLGLDDIWNHNRTTGQTGQGTSQSSTMEDVEPSLLWPQTP